MAHSLEARLPFLDQELVGARAAPCPPRPSSSTAGTARVLREGLRGLLPDVVYRRRKKIGFTTPEFRWYRRERAVLQGLLRSPSFTRPQVLERPRRRRRVPSRLRRRASRSRCSSGGRSTPRSGCGSSSTTTARASTTTATAPGFVRRGDAAVARRTRRRRPCSRPRSRIPATTSSSRSATTSCAPRAAAFTPDHPGRRHRRRDRRGDRARRRRGARRRRSRPREREGAVDQPGQRAPGRRHPDVAGRPGCCRASSAALRSASGSATRRRCSWRSTRSAAPASCSRPWPRP